MTPGTQNVFADLGFENADEMLAKADLVRAINVLIERRGLTQVQAAKLLHIHQPKVSALRRGRLMDFSIDALLRYLVLLGQEVNIRVRSAPARAGVKVGYARS